MNREWEHDYINVINSLKERGYKVEFNALDSAVVISVDQYDYEAQDALEASAPWFAIDGINADVESVTLFDMETMHTGFDEADWRLYDALRG